MEYTISEERLTKLIMKIIKSMEIKGLYRVQINFPKKSAHHIVVALFFDVVRDSEFFAKIHNDVTDRLEDLLGIEDPLVVTIPYSEAKFHLNGPRNI
jgi:hypothetical protein